MTDQLDGLLNIRHFLYQRAQWLWQASLLLTLLTLLFTLVGFWIGAPTLVGAVGAAVVVLPIAVAWIRESATTLQLRADKCRRVILLAEGIDREIAPSMMAEIRGWVAGKELPPAPHVAPYYSSAMHPGPQRLADMLAESAFFTENVSGKLQTWLWIAFGISLGISIGALLVADLASVMATKAVLLGVKSVAVFIAFLISGDVALLAKKYGDLRVEARHTYQKGVQLRDSEDASMNDVSEVAEDYGVALLQAPPIPSWVYVLLREGLNQAYRASHRLKNSGARAA